MLPAPLLPVAPICAIAYDINCPAGGITVNIPAGHPHHGFDNAHYYHYIADVLRNLGYDRSEYSMYSQATPPAVAIADARNMQTHPKLTWMASPGVMKSMHVVSHLHQGSLY